MAARPGWVQLVAATDVDASLLGFDCAEPTSGLPFADDSVTALRNATLALQRVAPVLVGQIDLRTTASGRHHCTIAIGDKAGEIKTGWSGTSFGLGFFLALASRAFGLPVPEDLIASATVDPTGALGPVNRVDAKLAVIAEKAKGVEHILVARDQPLDVTLARRYGLRILRFDTAQEALTQVFGTALASRIFPPDAPVSVRTAIADCYFRSAMFGDATPVEWKAYASGAEVALEAWRGALDDTTRDKLGFAAAITRRHTDNAPSGLLPPISWIEALPGTLRVVAAAHYVQQAIDIGQPSDADISLLVRTWLGDPRDDGDEHLKLRGAYCRLLMLQGVPSARDALELAEMVCDGWFQRFKEDQVDRPLCVWFLLAGALEDRQSFQRAEIALRRLEGNHSISSTSRSYIDLNRYRAAIDLAGDDRRARAVEGLRMLARDLTLPLQVRLSAIRQLGRARVPPSTDYPTEVGTLPSMFLGLHALDEAVSAGVESEVTTALSRLGAMSPSRSIVARLRRFADAEPVELGRYVARFFPY